MRPSSWIRPSLPRVDGQHTPLYHIATPERRTLCLWSRRQNCSVDDDDDCTFLVRDWQSIEGTASNLPLPFLPGEWSPESDLCDPITLSGSRRYRRLLHFIMRSHAASRRFIYSISHWDGEKFKFRSFRFLSVHQQAVLKGKTSFRRHCHTQHYDVQNAFISQNFIFFSILHIKSLIKNHTGKFLFLAISDYIQCYI